MNRTNVANGAKRPRQRYVRRNEIKRKCIILSFHGLITDEFLNQFPKYDKVTVRGEVFAFVCFPDAMSYMSWKFTATPVPGVYFELMQPGMCNIWR